MKSAGGSIRTNVVLAAALMCSILPGCARGDGPESEDPRPSASASVLDPTIQAEYAAREASFGAPSPDDVELPRLKDRIQDITDASDQVPQLEDGFAASTLTVIWQCAWERSFYDAVKNDDRAGRLEATIQLNRWYDLPMVKRYVHDPDRAWKSEAWDPARAGDLKPLEEQLDGSCGPPFTP